MKQTFAETIKREHLELRNKYHVSLFTALTFFGLIGMLIISLYTFIPLSPFLQSLVLPIGGSILFLYLLFIFIFYPLRFNYLQKELYLTFFKAARSAGLKLIPNTMGVQNFDYDTLLKEASIFKSDSLYQIARYEYDKRLIHVLYYKEGENVFAIIHIPQKECPYYLQVNNNNFAPPIMYKGEQIEKVAFVSAHKLNYYALKGPTNVKIYLRRELESRLIDILKIRDGHYQYVATYTDEFLLIDKYYERAPLRLNENYSDEYYIERLNNLLLIQQILNVMLDQRR